MGCFYLDCMVSLPFTNGSSTDLKIPWNLWVILQVMQLRGLFLFGVSSSAIALLNPLQYDTYLYIFHKCHSWKATTEEINVPMISMFFISVNKQDFLVIGMQLLMGFESKTAWSLSQWQFHWPKESKLNYRVNLQVINLLKKLQANVVS